MSRKTPSFTWRYWLLAVIFLILTGALLARLFKLQVMDHQTYVVEAQQQYQLGNTEIIPATRGTIKSSDGFDLATTQPAYLVHLNPSVLTDPHGTAEKLEAILAVAQPTPTPTAGAKQSSSAAQMNTDQKVSQLSQLLGNKNYQWVPVAHKIDQQTKVKIEALHIKGLGFDDEQKRYYPEGTLASQVLGFVGSDTSGNDHGYYGIEGYYDQKLRGKDGQVALERDPQGNPIPIGNYQSQPVEEGATITLTINRGLQYLIEQKLSKWVQQLQAESGSVILMEPSTGKVLAMANYPTYNPTDWQDSTVQSQQLFRNSAIMDAYEPGSVMKSFTTATGLELGIMTPTTTYTSAPYKVGDHTITTADNRYYGTATVQEMLEHSDNTGAAQFGTKIGKDNFLSWLHKIGLDRPTGITLEGEGDSIIPPPDQWLPITLATASFGQGVSVTPLQLLEMMATIANHGVQMQPTIIQSIAQDGQTTLVKPVSRGRIYSEKTSQEMAEMLQNVVAYGEFHRLALQGYQIAGKTSTAQIPENGTYDPNKVITTFVGYAPADNPEFVMLTKLNKPLINNSAETVVPMWMDMATDLFHYYGIAPGPTPVPSPAK